MNANIKFHCKRYKMQINNSCNLIKLWSGLHPTPQKKKIKKFCVKHLLLKELEKDMQSLDFGEPLRGHGDGRGCIVDVLPFVSAFVKGWENKV